jgi:hypothetical protein
MELHYNSRKVIIKEERMFSPWNFLCETKWDVWYLGRDVWYCVILSRSFDQLRLTRHRHMIILNYVIFLNYYRCWRVMSGVCVSARVLPRAANESS